MLLNAYTLPELIDLALQIPEVGAVNFNILHTILHTIVQELQIEDLRPRFDVENPLLNNIALTKAKLKEIKPRKPSLPESTKAENKLFSKEQIHPPSTVSDSAVQTDDIDTKSSPTTTKKNLTVPKIENENEEIKTEAPITKAKKKQHTASDSYNYENIKSRMEALEDTLREITKIVDKLSNKILQREKRKQEGGPAAEELEAIDDRLCEVEEALAKYAADHELLMDIDNRLCDMLNEFESIKALASQLEEMQLDISKKADKEETWAALALKGDLELVNTKVDRLEFETAIEELGEAIGLLRLKFIRKNEEWDERAAEIWRGIDGKMTRDIFEEAKVKIESRLMALMYGLKTIKNVVEDLLYPEASGVTRCILCRRPACISGLECIGITDSPKRPLSHSGSDDLERLNEIEKDAISKRQKMDVPPYSRSRDTIISIPESRFSYGSSVDGNHDLKLPIINLLPKDPRREPSNFKKISQVPKLPVIKNVDSSLNKKKTPSVRSGNLIMTRTKAKSFAEKDPLYFTKIMLARHESTDSENLQSEKSRNTAVLEAEPSKKVSSRKSSAMSSMTSIDVALDPRKALDAFTPARLMTDLLRREIISSPTSPREPRVNITLSPLQFDTE